MGRRDGTGEGGRGGRYLRIPSWASVTVRALEGSAAAASSVSIELEKHRPIPVGEPTAPEERHGGAVADGLSFDSRGTYAPGTVLELGVSFQPGEAPVTLRGEVVAAVPCDLESGCHHVRVGFIADAEAEVDVIAKFVEKFYG